MTNYTHDDAMRDLAYQRRVAGLSLLTDRDCDGMVIAVNGLDGLAAYITDLEEENARLIANERARWTMALENSQAGPLVKLLAENHRLIAENKQLRQMLQSQGVELIDAVEALEPVPLDAMESGEYDVRKWRSDYE